MKAIALKSFVGGAPNGAQVHVTEGDVFDLPPGTDWVQAGLARPLPAQAETAAVEPPERAVIKRPRKRKDG